MKLVVPYVAALCFLAGCSKNIDTIDAVKQGVVRDIAKRVDVRSMDVNVDSVSFRDKEADAQVSFVPKGGSRTQSVTMHYTMERQGDGWHIKNRSQGHGEQAPPGGPAAGAGGQLPAGHPPLDKPKQ